MEKNQLPEFEGYTADVRLRQFRKITKETIQFVSFESKKGEKMLLRYIESLKVNSEEFRKFIHHFKT